MAKPTIMDANLMFGTKLSDGSTRATVEGLGADVDENADCEVNGIGGILSPGLSLHEFIAGVNTTKQEGGAASIFCGESGEGMEEGGAAGTGELGEEEERWSGVSTSETEPES